MRQHHRLRHRRLALPLRLGQLSRAWSLAAAGAHHLPEFLEIMRRGQRRQPRLQLRRQVVIRRRHVAEFRVAQHAPVAPRHLQRMQHVHEGDGAAEAHVGVPVLPGIAQADRLPVLHHVGQDHHLGLARHLEGAGDMHLQRTEPPAERRLRRRVERLIGETQHAMRGDRAQHESEVFVRQFPRKIEAGDPRPQRIAARRHCKSHWRPHYLPHYLPHWRHCRLPSSRRVR